VSKEWSPKIGAAGAVVIDNSSAWRMDPDVPLIVPEVNANAVAGFVKKNIIANPNCSTAQLVVALKPLHDRAVIKRVVVSTYQSVSGAGKDAMDELFRRPRRFIPTANSSTRNSQAYRLQRDPEIDVFMEDGYTKEEWKMMMRPRRFLIPKSSLPRPVCGAGVCRPFRGGQYRVRETDLGRRGARHPAQCAGLPGDRQARTGRLRHAYEAAGEDATYISRIREDATVENGLVLWCVSDNLRKGAALNAIQIAECLINRKLISAKKKAA